jgi:DNA-directed RNA polymerase specialized sigma24 family protein
MAVAAQSEEQLLAGRDGASFERFYRRNADAVLAYFARRTHEPAVAADLTAETFAVALARRRRYRPRDGPAQAWLFAIAARQLQDAQRTGHPSRRARRRLGMRPLELSDGDLLRIRQQLAPAARSPVEASLVEVVIRR